MVALEATLRLQGILEFLEKDADECKRENKWERERDRVNKHFYTLTKLKVLPTKKQFVSQKLPHSLTSETSG